MLTYRCGQRSRCIYRFIYWRTTYYSKNIFNLNSAIYLVSHLADEIKKKLFIKNYRSLEEAFSNAIKIQVEKAKVLVTPYGGSTLPIFKG